MQTTNNKIVNLAKFVPTGKLGALFAQAKAYNKINTQLREILPAEINSLELCLIKETTAILITNNQAVAFRAQKQHKLLLAALTGLDGLAQITKITIKINLKNPALKPDTQ